jgi:transposase
MGDGRQGTRKGPRMIKEIQRLHSMGVGKKRIAQALGISKNTVKAHLLQSERSMTETPPSAKVTYVAPWADLMDWTIVKSATDHGFSLKDIWEESVQTRPETNLRGLPYVTFWREYRRRFPDIPLEMHKIHPPGLRCEVDYKGDSHGLGYRSLINGEWIPCRMFGAILCFSQLIYMEATETEKQGDFLCALANAYEYFGGVPQTTVVDNAKVGVTKADRYDADLNPEFQRFCEHYGTAPLATRAAKPKDKDLIEGALGLFWRWLSPRVRARTFSSRGDLNRFLREHLDLFNNRIQRKYGLSRRQKFSEGELAKLMALPETAYEYGEWKILKVHPDCHVQVGFNFYSVPFQRRGQSVDVRITGGTVEVFAGLERIAMHIKRPANGRGQYSTQMGHLPEAHQAVLEFTPQRALDDAASIGAATKLIVEALLHEARHPLLHLRRTQGILRLAKRHSAEALEQTCQLLLREGIRLPRLSDVEAILKNSALLEGADSGKTPVRRGPNPNLRGQQTWSSKPIH